MRRGWSRQLRPSRSKNEPQGLPFKIRNLLRVRRAGDPLISQPTTGSVSQNSSTYAQEPAQPTQRQTSVAQGPDGWLYYADFEGNLLQPASSHRHDRECLRSQSDPTDSAAKMATLSIDERVHSNRLINSQGVTKPGLSESDKRAYTIVYMADTRPFCLPEEEKYLTKEAIAVEKASPDQRLDPMSRLNFKKVYTIEHNVKSHERRQRRQRSATGIPRQSLD
jgi:hypothetical protein